MGLLDKVKNLFTEEVEVEVEETKPKVKHKKEKKKKEEPIQKEVIKVEIPAPEETETTTRQTRSELNTYEEMTREEPREDDYKFPFFDDDDFDVVKPEEKPKEEKKDYYKEVYNPPKEEKKVFKPSPIISPVYGFLDKDYQKEEIVSKRSDRQRRATVDELRDKAYGSLESDIETTLFGAQRVTFDDEDTKDLSNVDKELDKIEKDITPKIEKPRHKKEEDDLTDLLEAEMAKPEKEEKKKKSRKISDKELFNLIDSMYEGEIKW